jgi:hypothetical protein
MLSIDKIKLIYPDLKGMSTEGAYRNCAGTVTGARIKNSKKYGKIKDDMFLLFADEVDRKQVEYARELSVSMTTVNRWYNEYKGVKSYEE